MKKLIVILVILILAFGALSYWAVNVYAKPLQIGELKIVLVPEDDGVFLKSGEGEYQKVSEEIDLKVGDAIKTDETGSARIILFDTNEVSLDKNSEVVIEESFIDSETPFFTKIKLNLKKGQIWNRLLELLHPDAYFEVESGGVVATVRGTIFNMSNIDGNINIAVIENSVAVSEVGGTEVAETIKSGEEKEINFKKIKNINEAKIFEITETRKAGAWFKNNFLRDGKFREFIKEKKENILRQIGPLPGGRFYPAKRLGERVATLLTFDKNARAEREKNFAARKFLAARLLLAEGEKIRAFQVLKSISNIKDIAPIIRRADYYDRDFLKTEVQVLKNGVNGEAVREYLGKILLPGQLDFIKQKLEFSPILLPKLEEIIIEPLGSENFGNENLNVNTNTNTNTNVNTNQPAGPVCGDGVCALGEGSGVCDVDCPPPPPAPTITGLFISALPTSIPAQSSSKLTAETVWSDGSRKDVTGSVSWTVSQGATGAPMGSVNAGMFYSSGPIGTAIITGTYASGEQNFDATVNIQVVSLK